MRIAIYACVSTDKQDTENQLLQLREFAVRQGWTVVREYFDYESGSRADRTEFQQMFTDASKRKFDLLLFWALERLSREGALKTLQHLDRLEGYGVGFRWFTEPYFDSCGIFKEAVVSIVATLAKQERVKCSERTRLASHGCVLRVGSSVVRRSRSARLKSLACAHRGFPCEPSGGRCVTLAASSRTRHVLHFVLPAANLRDQ